ncbi:hypothetical protein [Streptomyces sp. NPDC058989]|uniref:hypothetical protein n=1 Tax=Streptomyces sp. NPDC058989 TaxID=3346686 RepID=UPI0036AD4028
MSHALTEAEVQEITQPIRDGGPISRLYATGEIQEDLFAALDEAAANEVNDERYKRIMDVVTYVQEAGERPPVAGWMAR